MRHIDIDAIAVTAKWLAEAERAKSAVAAGADINEYSAVWRDLKPEFGQFFFQKCWFCESNMGRSDNAVDHFRPKNRVAEAEREHNGYRWLAFDQTNFRYACTFCNSRRIDKETGIGGGKDDHFPLLDEDTRAYGEGDDIHDEAVALLDPYAPTDWRLLSCQPNDGFPCPTTDDRMDVERVKISIEVYHLDQMSLCRARHSTALGLLDAISQARSFFDTYTHTPTAGNKHKFHSRCRSVARYIKRSAPFSGEMKMLLARHRSEEHPWIAQLLET
tara:strand:- start:2040 stop:2861 length:822 start_codon:yes stop_codon:yes gene_type:complete